MGGGGGLAKTVEANSTLIVLLFNFHHVAEEIVRANEPI